MFWSKVGLYVLVLGFEMTSPSGFGLNNSLLCSGVGLTCQVQSRLQVMVSAFREARSCARESVGTDGDLSR